MGSLTRVTAIELLIYGSVIKKNMYYYKCIIMTKGDNANLKFIINKIKATVSFSAHQHFDF